MNDVCADPSFLNAFEPWYLDAYQRKPDARFGIRRLMTFAVMPAVLGFAFYEIWKTGFIGHVSKVIPASTMYTREGENDGVIDEEVEALWRRTVPADGASWSGRTPNYIPEVPLDLYVFGRLAQLVLSPSLERDALLADETRLWREQENIQ